MEERSLTTLEYDKIIARVSEHATSSAGQELCRRLKPSGNLRRIREWQQNTTDARTRIEKRGASLSFRGAKDPEEIIKRLAVGGTLNGAELLSVSSLLTVAERAKAYDSTPSGTGRGGKEEKENAGDSLTEQFELLVPLTGINNEIRRCILSEEEIADDATEGLSRVRRSITKTAASVRETMNVLLNRYRDSLSDAVITQRDGRYCLPVRAENKAKVPGMVHDASATGQTLYIEPMAVVKLNNELRELESEEKKEMEKVLAMLSASLMPHVQDLKDDADILKKLDMIFAKALYSMETESAEPEFSTDRSLRLIHARHPLLDRKKVVPVSLELGKAYNLLVITGPNTGGKTVTLKTAGLLTLMGQAGLHIPADPGSVLGVYENVYADIGDEQSIEQSLSTFSAHMTNIVRILENADKSCLCLFDELGAGTDPTEGAALAMALLNDLHGRKINTMATTHYSEIKVYALRTEGVENASCEFDVTTLRPTYRLLVGIPGKSNAFAISRRLGLPEYIIEEAGKYIESEDESFEEVIERLNEENARLEKLRMEAESAKLEAEEIRKRLKTKEDKLNEGRERMLRDAKAEARQILKDAKETADSAIKNIQKTADAGTGAGAEKERERLRTALRKTEDAGRSRVKGPSKPVSPRKIKPGDTVRIPGMGGVTGVVESVPDKDGNVFVRIGFMKSRLNTREVEYAEGPAAQQEESKSRVHTDFAPRALTIRPEINLIGMTTDEALPELEKYLDDAYLAHLEQVRIVHGRGTGALRSAVQEKLRKLKYIKSFRTGAYGEGDTGVTIAEFR